jgi:tetratricopeptide (TPR) repeat protein
LQEWLVSVVFYREAKVLIDGPEALALEEAQRNTRMAEFQRERLARAEADWRRADELAGNDPFAWVERARWYAARKVPERAAAAWQRVCDLAGDDPLPWIHLGRWYAECGEQEKADADFAKAASLTRNELNKFLEAGWWMIGPYSANLDEFCPPELDADPSKPMYVMDPQTGLSDAPVKWRNVATGRLGEVRLADAVAGSNGSAYALAHIYSPDERTALLRVARAKGIRIWCNGRLVLRTDAPLRDEVFFGERVPIALRSGRNQIVVRVGLNTPFAIQVGDAPLHRVISLAEQGLWREATEAGFQEESGAFRGSPPRVWLQAINAAQLGGCPQLLEREGDRLLELAMSDPDLWVRLRAASALVLVDNVRLREHGGALAASLKERRPELSTDPNYKKAALQALAEYALAARRPAEAEGFLAQDPAFKQRAYLPLKVLIKLQEGNRDEAVAALEEAFQRAAQPAGYWPLRVWFLTKLREAEKQITGGTDRSDKMLVEDRQAALADWESRDSATAAFDHLVATYRRPGTPATTPSYPYLARGQRLFELGRLNEAEADFDKAAELAPDNIDTLLVRARFHAERGNVARARDEFEATRNKAAAAKAKEGDSLRLIVEREIARH